MSKKVRRALLIVAVIVMLMSAVLLAYTLAPRPAPVIERTAIVPVAPVAP